MLYDVDIEASPLRPASSVLVMLLCYAYGWGGPKISVSKTRVRGVFSKVTVCDFVFIFFAASVSDLI